MAQNSSRPDHWRLVNITLAAMLLGAGLSGSPLRVGAEPTGLEPLTRRDQLLGWEAVGRLELAGQGYCTATLIAPDLVLTAAHCVVEQAADGTRRARQGMVFRAGYVNGRAVAESPVAAAVAGAGYTPGPAADTAERRTQLRNDVALLLLAEPIPAAVAAPFRVDLPQGPGQVSVVSYGEGRDDAPSWQRACQLLGQEEGLIAVNCAATFGTSGAPVLDRSDGRARIVSIISSGREEAGRSLAFGMELPQAVTALKTQLRRGEVLPFSGEATAAARTTGAPVARMAEALRPAEAAGSAPGTGARRQIGARFLRP